MLRFMRNKILIPSLIILALAAFFSFKYSKSDEEIKERKQLVLQTVVKAIERGHFASREIDDSLSLKIYEKNLSTLDYEKKFFTKNEIKVLEEQKYLIDDQIQSGSIKFYTDLNSLYKQQIKEVEGFYKELLKKPFDFTTKEEITLGGDDLEYVANNTALKKRWHSYLKLRTLGKYVDLKDYQEQRVKDKDTSLKKVKTNKELEAEARESVLTSQERYFKRLKKLDDDRIFTIYINSITNSEDPHTDYFPPQDKKQFDIAMSGSFFGIGAQLQESDGSIKITAIIPGSPCWKQGELKAGDEIIKVAQAEEEPVDVRGFDLEDVVKIIRGKKGTEVRLTVKKVSGTVKVIPIIRDEVLLEDGFAKSAIIKTPDQGAIGYIYLPSFYADFQKINGRRCSEDVAIEVLKLKNSGVDGIILDLRNNGGGSLSDVVDMTGIFIDKGPIVQVKSNGAPPTTLEDRQTGAIYDGPLAIMVNQGSASASEIMAAALQDYKRAVIIGSTTFGKGTVQKIISLDRFLSVTDKLTAKTKNNLISDDPVGSLKLTVQKFYRINGGSTQLKGVTPDITLPDAYEHIDIGERSNESALEWDVIPSADYETVVNAVDAKKLEKLSKERVKANQGFNIISETAKRIKEQREDKTYPLDETTYVAEQKESEEASKRLEELEEKTHQLIVENIAEDLKKINLDSSSIEKNDRWIKGLKKDIQLEEAVNIVNDMKRMGVATKVSTGSHIE